ncbi:MAG: hypothetical protein M1839_000651 [Geoglossum umbratile]|nr:MAG: hypothetical protein M1839_000651 [Geoglossum umbratile]
MAEGTIIEKLFTPLGSAVFGVARMNHDEQRTIERDIRKGMEELGRDACTNVAMNTWEYKDRIFTKVLLRDVGRPLEEVATPLELVRIILGAFIGHCTLYHNAHILHRDISTNNILIATTPLPGPNASIPKLHGFLIDLDLSVAVDPSTLTYTESGDMCLIGTRAFLATGILVNLEARHTYHHDVETFLYVMIWISTVWRGHTHQNDPLAGWQAESSRDCWETYIA